MNKKVFMLFALIFTLTIFSAANAEGVWRLDGEAGMTTRNFRLMTEDWKVDFVTAPSRKYLDTFYASASGQPTLSGLNEIFDTLKKVAPNDKKIYMVDLRQESHGFADEYPISWYIKKNRGNVDKNFAEIARDERRRLWNLRGQSTEFVPLGNYDTEHFHAVTFAPKVTLTEKQAAESAGFQYVRFYALDMTFPAPEIVDEFLNFIAQIDSDAWLHFHCQAGHGRTTIFLVIYDILKHPDLSLENIVQRQYSLGGSNLFENDEYEKNIKLFYTYAHELQEKKTAKTWSDWLLER